MSSSEHLAGDGRSRQLLYFALGGAASVHGVVTRFTHLELSDPVLALVFGSAIVGADFLLSWAAEAAQIDVFAEFGAECRSPAAAAAGNESPCALDRSHSVELAFLAVATAYSLTIPLKHSITLIDAAVLVALFAVYMVRITQAPAAEEPHLVGPARLIGAMPKIRRRVTVVATFIVAAVVILLCAEEFAHSLTLTGRRLGVGEFFLVQWLAPLASEAPELVVAGLYAWRLNTNGGLGTLVSSKVNQWTLLVGTLPIAFAIAAGSLDGLPIIARQREELLLTAAQSLFAVAVLVNLSMSLREAGALFGLFAVQFLAGAIVPPEWHGPELVFFSVVYLILGAGIFLRKRRETVLMVRRGFTASYAQLRADAVADSSH